MKRRQRLAYTKLKKMGAPVRERSDLPDTFYLSAEENDTRTWAEYYYGLEGYPYVDPDVEEVVRSYGLFLEWENPGCLVAYD